MSTAEPGRVACAYEVRRVLFWMSGVPGMATRKGCGLSPDELLLRCERIAERAQQIVRNIGNGSTEELER